MHTPSHRASLSTVILTVLWFGTLWGATEALLGGLLHAALPPTYPGRLMIAVAVALMAYAVRRTGSPWMAVGMALVAAPLKLFSALVFALPWTAPVVVNPAFAILAQGLAVTAAALALRSVRANDALRYGGIGAAAGGVHALVYVGLVLTVGLWIYPSTQLLQELGTKFPMWTLSASSVVGHLWVLLPWAVLAGAVGGVVGGSVPVRSTAPFGRAFLAAGSTACLIVFFATSLQL